VTGPGRFWGSAVGAAIVFGALAPWLFPYGALGMDPATERERVWLVVVFYTGVMTILFGLAALISGPRVVSARDVAEAGGVPEAVDRARRARAGRPERALRWRNFATWTIAFGATLVLGYFALWIAISRG
jgi:hypothetical protein